MKQFCLFFILLFTCAVSQAQQAGQLYVTSYDDTGEIVYVCNGQPENSVPVRFAMLNLNQSVPLIIDSIVPRGNPSVFQDQQVIIIPNFVLGYVGTGGDATFSPSVPGDDTIYETVYYNGEYTATASITYHARNAPDLAMYGYEITWAYLVDGYGFGAYNQEAETDTMFDSIETVKFTVGSGPYENGDAGVGTGGQPVLLRTCGGAIIDSIYEVGDFSDFAFDPFPSLPRTMKGGDSLLLNFEFTPKAVDTSGSRHYLVFHSTDGHYLVWSFTYWVFPASSVAIIPETNSDIRIFPNPAANDLEIESGPSGTARLFDVLGREVLDATDDGTGVTMDVSHLEAGTYFLRMGTQSAKIVINR